MHGPGDPAVDEERLPGDVARKIGGQEEDRPGDLRWRCGCAQRDLLSERFPLRFIEHHVQPRCAHDGATAFTRTRAGPNSLPMVATSCMRAALAAPYAACPGSDTRPAMEATNTMDPPPVSAM